MNDSTSLARLTFLISPQEKRAFADLCASQDLTSSQVMRRLIAAHLEQHDTSVPPTADRPAVPREP